MKGGHSNGSWRYNKVKHWKQRALKLRSNSQSPEEFRAWSIVLDWFERLLKRDRYFSNGVIKLR